MKTDDAGGKNYGNPRDVMVLLAKEAEDVIALAGKSAYQEAADETEKMLQQYEQKAKQIILKIREETHARADEMAVRFRDALMLGVEEASTAALNETINEVGTKTAEIVKRLQEAVRREARQALAEGLMAGDDKARSVSRGRLEEARPTAEPETSANSSETGTTGEEKPQMAETPQDFEQWLMQ